MKEWGVTYHCTGCGKLFKKNRRRVKCPKCGHYLTANCKVRSYFGLGVEEELSRLLMEEIEKEIIAETGESSAQHDERVLSAIMAYQVMYGSKNE